MRRILGEGKAPGLSRICSAVTKTERKTRSERLQAIGFDKLGEPGYSAWQGWQESGRHRDGLLRSHFEAQEGKSIVSEQIRGSPGQRSDWPRQLDPWTTCKTLEHGPCSLFPTQRWSLPLLFFELISCEQTSTKQQALTSLLSLFPCQSCVLDSLALYVRLSGATHQFPATCRKELSVSCAPSSFRSDTTRGTSPSCAATCPLPLLIPTPLLHAKTGD